VPLSVVGALVLVSQAVVQNLTGFRTASTLAGGTQQIPGGPVASMEVIKLLGTNGGSVYGTGGAHPFENPTGFTNLFDLLLVIVLPFAIIFMFGRATQMKLIVAYVLAIPIVVLASASTSLLLKAGTSSILNPGSLAGARTHARTRATLDTSGLTFAAFLVGVIVIVGGLIYFPMLILGPIRERIVG
jgi:potassium-transporting ATPase potassium-binding subunit